MASLRQQLAERGAGDVSALLHSFHVVDHAGEGRLTRQQFSDALSGASVPVASEHTDMLFDYFKQRGTDVLVYHDFLRAVAGAGLHDAAAVAGSARRPASAARAGAGRVRPVSAAANRIVEARWTSYCQALHEERLRSIKPQIDTSAPRTTNLLKGRNAKRASQERQRSAAIQRENHILIRKILDLDSKQMKARGVARRCVHCRTNHAARLAASHG